MVLSEKALKAYCERWQISAPSQLARDSLIREDHARGFVMPVDRGWRSAPKQKDVGLGVRFAHRPSGLADGTVTA